MSVLLTTAAGDLVIDLNEGNALDSFHLLKICKQATLSLRVADTEANKVFLCDNALWLATDSSRLPGLTRPEQHVGCVVEGLEHFTTDSTVETHILDDPFETQQAQALPDSTLLTVLGDRTTGETQDRTLFLCKLNPITRAKDLRIIFGRFGTITECTVVADPLSTAAKPKSRGFGFVSFSTKEACEQAFLKMHNVLIDDFRIHVDFGHGAKPSNDPRLPASHGPRQQQHKSSSQRSRSRSAERQSRYSSSSKKSKRRPRSRSRDKASRHHGEGGSESRRDSHERRPRSRSRERHRAANDERSRGDHRRARGRSRDRDSRR